jgi:hypothetical protein
MWDKDLSAIRTRIGTGYFIENSGVSRIVEPRSPIRSAFVTTKVEPASSCRVETLGLGVNWLGVRDDFRNWLIREAA